MISTAKSQYVLDASALLAVILGEPGNDTVMELIDRAHIHAVNMAEVAKKLVKEGVPLDEVRQTIEDLDIEVDEGLGTPQALCCGELIARTRQYGLGLGDCLCLTVSAWGGGTAVTADREWQKTQGMMIAGNPIKVQLIR